MKKSKKIIINLSNKQKLILAIFFTILSVIFFLIRVTQLFEIKGSIFLIDNEIYRDAFGDFLKYQLYSTPEMFYYTPLFFLIYSPVIFFPILHIILFPIYYGLILYLLYKRLPFFVYMLSIFIVSLGASLDFFHGNVNTFILLIGLLIFILLDKKMDFTGGLIFGLLCFKPNVLIIAPFYIFYKKKSNKRFLSGFLITGLLNFVSILVITDIFSYLNHVFTKLGHYDYLLELIFVAHYWIYIIPISSFFKQHNVKFLGNHIKIYNNH